MVKTQIKQHDGLDETDLVGVPMALDMIGLSTCATTGEMKQQLLDDVAVRDIHQLPFLAIFTAS